MLHHPDHPEPEKKKRPLGERLRGWPRHKWDQWSHWKFSMGDMLVGTGVLGTALGFVGIFGVEADRRHTKEVIRQGLGKGDPKAVVESLGWRTLDSFSEISGDVLISVMEDNSYTTQERLDMLKKLIAKGANVNDENFFGYPLMVACQQENVEAFDLLFLHSNREAKNAALNWATSKHMVDQLIPRSSQDARDFCFTNAARQGTVEVIPSLLASGISPEAQRQGLQKAIDNNQDAMVSLLHEAGVTTEELSQAEKLESRRGEQQGGSRRP